MEPKPEPTLEDAAALLPEAAPKRAPTSKEIGQWRRAYITVVHSTVNACGHKLSAASVPKNNCVYCWYAYFAMYSNIEELMNDLRGGAFKAKYGDKMYKNFRGFVATELKKMQDEGANAVYQEGKGNPSQKG